MDVAGLRSLVWALAGVAVAVVAWALLVPWDLSEVSADGRMLDGGGDDIAAPIGLVGAIVVIAGLAAVSHRTTRRGASLCVAGGLAAWSVLFAWRAGVAETSGANLFMVPLVMVFVPVTLVAPLLVARLGRRFDSTVKP